MFIYITKPAFFVKKKPVLKNCHKMTLKMYYRENFSKTLKNRRSVADAQLRIELLLQRHSRRFFIPKPFCVRQDNSSTCTLRLTRPFASSHSVHDHGELMDANRFSGECRTRTYKPRRAPR